MTLPWVKVVSSQKVADESNSLTVDVAVLLTDEISLGWERHDQIKDDRKPCKHENTIEAKFSILKKASRLKDIFQRQQYLFIIKELMSDCKKERKHSQEEQNLASLYKPFQPKLKIILKQNHKTKQQKLSRSYNQVQVYQFLCLYLFQSMVEVGEAKTNQEMLSTKFCDQSNAIID